MKKDIHKPGRPRKTLEPDFAKNLLLAYQTRTTRQLARDYHVTQPTICSWLKIARTMNQDIGGNLHDR